MKKKVALAVISSICGLMVLFLPTMATSVSESEPNDSSANANILSPQAVMNAAIEPIADLDYFNINGVNSTWGVIALLDSSGSTASTNATLSMLGTDGNTVLQSDSGSWMFGSGIALQAYTDGAVPHYLRVNETDNDQSISAYTLRYYSTVILPQPETDLNNSLATGTPSSFTHDGTINPAGDRDCYLFDGRAGDTILLALNGDPEQDGSPADLKMTLFDPSGGELRTADFSGAGENEFIEYSPLSVEGVYAYCVEANSPSAGGVTATYTVGIVRNESLYYPRYSGSVQWLNPNSHGYAYPGDLFNLPIKRPQRESVENPRGD